MGNVWGINECTVADVGKISIKKSVWNEELGLVFASSPRQQLTVPAERYCSQTPIDGLKS